MRGKVRCGPESRPAASLKRRGFRRETVSGSEGGFLEARRETHGPGRHEARALARGSGFKGGLRGSGRRRSPDCRRHAGRRWSGLGDECTGRDRQVPLHCGAGEPRRRSLSCGGRCRSGWRSGLGRTEAGRGIWNSRRSLPPPTRVKRALGGHRIRGHAGRVRLGGLRTVSPTTSALCCRASPRCDLQAGRASADTHLALLPRYRSPAR